MSQEDCFFWSGKLDKKWGILPPGPSGWQWSPFTIQTAPIMANDAGTACTKIEFKEYVWSDVLQLIQAIRCIKKFRLIDTAVHAAHLSMIIKALWQSMLHISQSDSIMTIYDATSYRSNGRGQCACDWPGETWSQPHQKHPTGWTIQYIL